MKRTMVVALVSIGLFLLGACGGGGSSGGDPQGPAAPTGLQVDTTSQDSVSLSWTDNATDETGFWVESGPTAAGPFQTVATLGQDEITYMQSTLNPGTYYYYRVCSYNADGNSPYTEVVLATTQSAPGGGYPLPAIADTLGAVEVYARDSSGYINTTTVYFSPGPDSAWGTSDDDIEKYGLPTYNLDDTRDHIELYGDPGGDGDWFTGDDPITGYTTFAYNSTGNMIARNHHNDAGTDTTWGTGDDVVWQYVKYNYDSSDRLTGYIYYNDPGGDGDWFTGDDVAWRIYKDSYGSDGRKEQRIQSRNPGDDGDWFTPDDVVYRYYTFDYDLYGNPFRHIAWYIGDDGIWFTDDDELAYYSMDIYDQSGINHGWYEYYGPGSDGVWFQ